MLRLFGDVFSGFFLSFSTTDVSLNSEAINLLHHIRLLCSRSHLQEALKLFTPSLHHLHSSIPTTPTPPSSKRAPAAVLSPKAKLSNATCFYTTPNPISTSSWLIMLLTCMLNVGHWILPTNCLMKCWRGIFVSWTALVSGYAQHGRPDGCFRVFRTC